MFKHQFEVKMMRINRLRVAALAGLALLLATDCLAEPAPGIYVIWPGAKPSLLERPGIAGGQVFVQWADLQPSSATDFDFRKLESQLARIAKTGRQATIQVNAAEHPAWLFERIPYLPRRDAEAMAETDPAVAHMLRHTRAATGVPMYWHPNYLEAYRALLNGLADYIRASALKEHIAGVRQNYNAIGTEHSIVPQAVRYPDVWHYPPEVSPASRWSMAVAVDYRDRVIDAHLDAFGYHDATPNDPVTTVFLRAGCFDSEPEDPDQSRCAKLLRNNEALGLFHTSSRPEPYTRGQERQYEFMRAHCKKGRRPCYAEPWGAAVAENRIDGPELPPMTPSQWHYWRHLLDLSLGASIIAEYAADLQFEHPPAQRRAFSATRTFSAKYAGALRNAAQSPGAWIAFRGGTYLPGDYEFLLQAQEATGFPPRSIKPMPDNPDAADRVGAWVRQLEVGHNIELLLDAEFARSLREGAMDLRIVAKPVSGPADLTVATTDSSTQIHIPHSASESYWQEHRVAALIAQRDDGSFPITLTADRHPIQLHMIEVRREQ